MGQTIADVSKATGLSLEALDKLQASDENSVKASLTVGVFDFAGAGLF